MRDEGERVQAVRFDLEEADWAQINWAAFNYGKGMTPNEYARMIVRAEAARLRNSREKAWGHKNGQEG